MKAKDYASEVLFCVSIIWMWYIQVEFYQFLTRPSCTVSLFFFCKVKFPIYISCPGFKARRFTLQKNGRSVFNWKYSQNPSWYWGHSGVFQLLKYIFFLSLLSFSFFFLLGGRWRKVSNWVWTCSWEGKVWNREW